MKNSFEIFRNYKPHLLKLRDDGFCKALHEVTYCNSYESFSFSIR